MEVSTKNINTKAIKLPFTFNAGDILEEVNTIPFHHYNESRSLCVNREKLYKLDLISPVRAGPDEDDIEFPSKEILKERPKLQSILKKLSGEKVLYRVQHFKPGGVITKHRDRGCGLTSGRIRIHIPVKTNDDVHFIIDNERIHMRKGECWVLDPNYPHAVDNKGQQERIHLMIDCKLNDWWQEQLLTYGININELSQYNDYTTEDLGNMVEAFSHMNTQESEGIIKDIKQELISRQGHFNL